MSSVIENIIKSYPTGEALGAYVRVKKSGDNVVAAGAGEPGIGVTLANADSGSIVSVRLFNGYGSCFMKASAAIAKNALVYPTASGKVDDAVASTNAGAPLGYAEGAATADGDIIEVLLVGGINPPPTAAAAQAAASDAATTQALANALRDVLIARGFIKGAA